MNTLNLDYTKMNKALELVGFITIVDRPGFFKHALLGDRVFDFTACSIEGAIATLYWKGEAAGTKRTARRMGRLIERIEEKP